MRKSPGTSNGLNSIVDGRARYVGESDSFDGRRRPEFLPKPVGSSQTQPVPAIDRRRAGASVILVVRYLHQNGVKLNACDNGPICAACAGGHLEIVRYLHQNGIRLDARNDEPICQACAAGTLEVVRYLHQNGIKRTGCDGEPLCRACESGDLAVVRYLTENGAAVGRAWHRSCYVGRLGAGTSASSVICMTFGIDLNARNNEALFSCM